MFAARFELFIVCTVCFSLSGPTVFFYFLYAQRSITPRIKFLREINQLLVESESTVRAWRIEQSGKQKRSDRILFHRLLLRLLNEAILIL